RLESRVDGRGVDDDRRRGAGGILLVVEDGGGVAPEGPAHFGQPEKPDREADGGVGLVHSEVLGSDEPDASPVLRGRGGGGQHSQKQNSRDRSHRLPPRYRESRIAARMSGFVALR